MVAVIQVLGEHLKLRQQVIATATVYFKRFYARNSLKNIDPLLLAPTCVFLASKVEEFGQISNNRMISTCQTVGKYFINLLISNIFKMFYVMLHYLHLQLKQNLVTLTTRNSLIDLITY